MRKFLDKFDMKRKRAKEIHDTQLVGSNLKSLKIITNDRIILLFTGILIGLFLLLNSIGLVFYRNYLFLAAIIYKIAFIVSFSLVVIQEERVLPRNVIRLFSVSYYLISLFILLIGLSRIYQPLKYDLLDVFPIIFLLFLLSLVTVGYLTLVTKFNGKIDMFFFKDHTRADILSIFMIIISITGINYNITFLEGLFVVGYVIPIIVEKGKINLDRFTNHILIFLNGDSKTYEEILSLDKKVAMLFGAPVFLNIDYNKKTIWWIDVGLKVLLTRGLITKKGDKYFLTDKGSSIAEKKTKNMIAFFKIIKKFFRENISPLMSLIVHLFLGGLKMTGFLLTGSISLLSDGLDSIIDALSSIIVSLAMKFKKETAATLLLVILMFITAVSVIGASLMRIINPLPLEEELFAVIVALISIISCLLLYLYQRYSGYYNRSITILAQSEDSKNHVLNAIFVIIAIMANHFKLFFIDGLVGLFIGFFILMGAYELLQDLHSIRKGEKIDFERYKLGIWRFYNRWKTNILKDWVLLQVSYERDLFDSFNKDFSPIVIKSKNESFVINYSYSSEAMKDQLELLIEEKSVISDTNGNYCLTEKGKQRLDKIIRSFKHHSSH